MVFSSLVFAENVSGDQAEVPNFLMYETPIPHT
jgi:hypothetical protein